MSYPPCPPPEGPRPFSSLPLFSHEFVYKFEILLYIRTVTGYKCWTVLFTHHRDRRWPALKLLNVPLRKTSHCALLGKTRRGGLTGRGRTRAEQYGKCLCQWKGVVFCGRLCNIANAVSFSPQSRMHSGSGREGKFNSLRPHEQVTIGWHISRTSFSFFFFSLLFSPIPSCLRDNYIWATKNSRRANHFEKHF